jgi:hypothetical protein
MPQPTKMSDLPNFKQLEAMALEAGRMLSESKELCETLAASHLECQARILAKCGGDAVDRSLSNASSELLARMVKDPFHLSRKFRNI